MSIAITQVLKRIVDNGPNILAKLSEKGDKAVSLKEYMSFVREIARAQAASSKAIADVSAAMRAANGVPSTAPVVHQHLHAQIATRSAPPVLAAADGDAVPSTENRAPEAHAKMKQLLESYRRLTSPLVFDGMEDGIVDGDREDEDDSN